MKILIIGGTNLIGRHIVFEAIKKRHQVTLFNRNLTNPNLFPELELLKGDRNLISSERNELKFQIAKGRTWDCIIDCCGFHPDQLQSMIDVALPATSQYIFISTCSVYSTQNTPPINENANLAQLNETSESVYAKIQCENIVTKSCKLSKKKSLLLRCGLVIGNYDTSDRLGYWIRRIFSGDQLLVPEEDYQPLQLISVKNIAEFVVNGFEKGFEGVFNLSGYFHSDNNNITLKELLHTINLFFKKRAEFCFIPSAYLLAQNIRPWIDIPFWLSPNSDMQKLMFIDNSKATDQGLLISNLIDTLKEVSNWYVYQHFNDNKWLPKSEESNLINKWKKQSND